jgi:hypothetical protein
MDSNSKNGFYHRCKICTDFYYKKCTYCLIFRSKEHFYKNKNHKDKLEYKCKICRGRTKENIKDTYFSRHKRERLDKQAAWNRKKRKEDPFFRIASTMRARISLSLKVNKWHKDSKISEWIGCTKEEFVKHLESQWSIGMNWSNYGNKKGCWSVDHKIPISSAKSKEDIIKLSHFSNLQPLWVEDNIRKSNL